MKIVLTLGILVALYTLGGDTMATGQQPPYADIIRTVIAEYKRQHNDDTTVVDTADGDTVGDIDDTTVGYTADGDPVGDIDDRTVGDTADGDTDDGLDDNMVNTRDYDADDYAADDVDNDRRTDGNYNAASAAAREIIIGNAERELEEEALSLLTGDDREEMILRTLQLVNRDVHTFNYCDYVPSCNFTSKYRTINGTCNNRKHPEWGMANAQHKRRLTNQYADGVSKSRNGSTNVSLPNERTVSNKLHKSDNNQTEDEITLAVFAWGQFLDHDMASTPEAEISEKAKRRCCRKKNKRNKECLILRVPANDGFFPNNYCMRTVRSAGVNLCEDPTVRNQFNQITSFIDASNVYGSSDKQAQGLRSGIGGRMKVETGNLPPNASNCRAKKPTPCFDTGDHRANVVPTLASLHVLFVREHNRIAAILGDLHPGWSDETIYQETRRIVSAVIQKITYGEFLPRIFNADTMTYYKLALKHTEFSKEYDEKVNPTVSGSFCIAWRIGHSWIPGFMKGLFKNGKVSSSEKTQDTFLTPHQLVERNYKGLSDIALNSVNEHCPRSDAAIVDAARNSLFETSSTAKDGQDLMVLNLLREREWGLPSYPRYRVLYGYPSLTDWDDLTKESTDLPATHTVAAVQKLKDVYASWLDIDLLTGLLTETHLPGSIVGPTTNFLLAKQFKEVKIGDSHWFENGGLPGSFTKRQLKEIRKMTLSKVMCHNLAITQIQEDAFKVPGDRKLCKELIDVKETIDLTKW